MNHKTFGPWKAASGHPSGWRVVRTREEAPTVEQAEGPSGKLRIFKTMKSAQAAARKLNKAGVVWKAT